MLALKARLWVISLRRMSLPMAGSGMRSKTKAMGMMKSVSCGTTMSRCASRDCARRVVCKPWRTKDKEHVPASYKFPPGLPPVSVVGSQYAEFAKNESIRVDRGKATLRSLAEHSGGVRFLIQSNWKVSNRLAKMAGRLMKHTGNQL